MMLELADFNTGTKQFTRQQGSTNNTRLLSPFHFSLDNLPKPFLLKWNRDPNAGTQSYRETSQAIRMAVWSMADQAL